MLFTHSVSEFYLTHLFPQFGQIFMMICNSTHLCERQHTRERDEDGADGKGENLCNKLSLYVKLKSEPSLVFLFCLFVYFFCVSYKYLA